MVDEDDMYLVLKIDMCNPDQIFLSDTHSHLLFLFLIGFWENVFRGVISNTEQSNALFQWFCETCLSNCQSFRIGCLAMGRANAAGDMPQM